MNQKVRSANDGSSPRVRGTDRHVAVDQANIRFIPACAGNRPRNDNRDLSGSVHPRVCGEQTSAKDQGHSQRGSSPRVRGTARCGPWGISPLRFIPACAGNRISAITSAGVDSVHPRVCGEQRSLSWSNSFVAGSSPRVRGTVNRLSRRRCCERFIPACAGNRVFGGSKVRRVSVHPRVCGEQAARSSDTDN